MRIVFDGSIEEYRQVFGGDPPAADDGFDAAVEKLTAEALDQKCREYERENEQLRHSLEAQRLGLQDKQAQIERLIAEKRKSA